MIAVSFFADLHGYAKALGGQGHGFVCMLFRASEIAQFVCAAVRHAFREVDGQPSLFPIGILSAGERIHEPA
jgi:hypothetical protein